MKCHENNLNTVGCFDGTFWRRHGWMIGKRSAFKTRLKWHSFVLWIFESDQFRVNFGWLYTKTVCWNRKFNYDEWGIEEEQICGTCKVQRAVDMETFTDIFSERWGFQNKEHRCLLRTYALFTVLYSLAWSFMLFSWSKLVLP